jgi:hypothetical protein
MRWEEAEEADGVPFFISRNSQAAESIFSCAEA